jgi:hypothetical protein
MKTRSFKSVPVTGPDLILDLPKGLFTEFLTKWLTVQQVCRLDSVYCNRNKRELFLNSVAEDVVFSNDPFLSVDMNRFTEWLVKRKMKLSRIKISMMTMPNVNMMAPMLKISGKCMNFIALHNYTGNSLDKVALEIANNCKTLTKLTLMDCDIPKGFERILKACTKIAELRIYECKEFNSIKLKRESAQTLLNRCPQLRILDISYSGTGTTLGEFARACPNLMKLDISYCKEITDESIFLVAKHCTRLTTIGFFKVEVLTDDAIVELAKSCPLLTTVDIASCDFLTNASVIALATHCKLLQKLYIQSNTNFGDPALVALAQNSSHLEILYCGHCTDVTDVGIKAIAENCGKLKRIVMGDNDTITDAAVVAIASSCPHLIELGLGAMSICDVALNAVALHCPHLEQLDIQESSNLTHHGIFSIVLNCTKLNTLIITEDCPVVNEFSQLLWKHIRPGLTISSDPALITYFIFD